MGHSLLIVRLDLVIPDDGRRLLDKDRRDHCTFMSIRQIFFSCTQVLQSMVLPALQRLLCSSPGFAFLILHMLLEFYNFYDGLEQPRHTAI